MAATPDMRAVDLVVALHMALISVVIGRICAVASRDGSRWPFWDGAVLYANVLSGRRRPVKSSLKPAHPRYRWEFEADSRGDGDQRRVGHHRREQRSLARIFLDRRAAASRDRAVASQRLRAVEGTR